MIRFILLAVTGKFQVAYCISHCTLRADSFLYSKYAKTISHENCGEIPNPFLPYRWGWIHTVEHESAIDRHDPQGAA
jgi:hypothetical protein